jgi:hypothetical protein
MKKMLSKSDGGIIRGIKDLSMRGTWCLHTPKDHAFMRSFHFKERFIEAAGLAIN